LTQPLPLPTYLPTHSLPSNTTEATSTIDYVPLLLTTMQRLLGNESSKTTNL